jgi:hypothetical protein
MIIEDFLAAIERGEFDDVFLPSHIEIVALMLAFSIALMSWYIVSTWRKKGEEFVSISDLAYKFGRTYRWAVFTWAVTLLFCPALFMATPGHWDVTSHVFTTCLLLIGVIPLTGNDRKGGRIVLGTFSCLISQMLVGLLCPMWFSLWIVMGVLVALSETRICGERCLPKVLDGKGILIAEMLCMASFYGSLLCNLVKMWRYGY